MGHPRIEVGSAPAWVGEESINPFLDEIVDIPHIGPSSFLMGNDETCEILGMGKIKLKSPDGTVRNLTEV